MIIHFITPDQILFLAERIISAWPRNFIAFAFRGMPRSLTLFYWKSCNRRIYLWSWSRMNSVTASWVGIIDPNEKIDDDRGLARRRSLLPWWDGWKQNDLESGWSSSRQNKQTLKECEQDHKNHCLRSSQQTVIPEMVCSRRREPHHSHQTNENHSQPLFNCWMH